MASSSLNPSPSSQNPGMGTQQKAQTANLPRYPFTAPTPSSSSTDILSSPTEEESAAAANRTEESSNSKSNFKLSASTLKCTNCGNADQSRMIQGYEGYTCKCCGIIFKKTTLDGGTDWRNFANDNDPGGRGGKVQRAGDVSLYAKHGLNFAMGSCIGGGVAGNDRGFGKRLAEAQRTIIEKREQKITFGGGGKKRKLVDGSALLNAGEDGSEEDESEEEEGDFLDNGGLARGSDRGQRFLVQVSLSLEKLEKIEYMATKVFGLTESVGLLAAGLLKEVCEANVNLKTQLEEKLTSRVGVAEGEPKKQTTATKGGSHEEASDGSIPGSASPDGDDGSLGSSSIINSDSVSEGSQNPPTDTKPPPPQVIATRGLTEKERKKCRAEMRVPVHSPAFFSALIYLASKADGGHGLTLDSMHALLKKSSVSSSWNYSTHGTLTTVKDLKKSYSRIVKTYGVMVTKVLARNFDKAGEGGKSAAEREGEGRHNNYMELSNQQTSRAYIRRLVRELSGDDGVVAETDVIRPPRYNYRFIDVVDSFAAASTPGQTLDNHILGPVVGATNFTLPEEPPELKSLPLSTLQIVQQRRQQQMLVNKAGRESLGEEGSAGGEEFGTPTSPEDNTVSSLALVAVEPNSTSSTAALSAVFARSGVLVPTTADSVVSTATDTTSVMGGGSSKGSKNKSQAQNSSKVRAAQKSELAVSKEKQSLRTQVENLACGIFDAIAANLSRGGSEGGDKLLSRVKVDKRAGVCVLVAGILLGAISYEYTKIVDFCESYLRLKVGTIQKIYIGPMFDPPMCPFFKEEEDGVLAEDLLSGVLGCTSNTLFLRRLFSYRDINCMKMKTKSRFYEVIDQEETQFISVNAYVNAKVAKARAKGCGNAKDLDKLRAVATRVASAKMLALMQENVTALRYYLARMDNDLRIA